MNLGGSIAEVLHWARIVPAHLTRSAQARSYASQVSPPIRWVGQPVSGHWRVFVVNFVAGFLLLEIMS